MPSFTNSVLLSLSRFPSEEPDINTSDSDSSHSDRVIIGFEIWIRSLKPCYYLELLTQAVFRNDFSSKAFCQSFFHSHPLSWMQKGRKEKRQLFLSRLQFRILYSLAGSQRQSHLNYCGVLHLSFNQSFFHASHSDFSLIVKEREREREQVLVSPVIPCWVVILYSVFFCFCFRFANLPHVFIGYYNSDNRVTISSVTVHMYSFILKLYGRLFNPKGFTIVSKHCVKGNNVNVILLFVSHVSAVAPMQNYINNFKIMFFLMDNIQSLQDFAIFVIAEMTAKSRKRSEVF